MKRSRLLLFSSCVCAVFLFSECLSFAAESKTLNIGAVDSLTGWMAAGENPTHEGSVLAAGWINDKGGITVKGVKYKIKLITEDAKSSPEGMAAACTKLVEKNKVKFIIGGVNGVMNIAASSVTEPAGVLRLANYNTVNRDEIGSKVPLSFFSNTTIQGMRPQLTYLKEKYPQAKKLALSSPGDQEGQYRAMYLKPIAEALGLTVVHSGEWPGETVDFTPIMQKALAFDPDAIVFMDGWAYHVGAQIKAARAVGFKGPVLSTDSEIVTEVLQITGADVGEGYFACAWEMYSPEMPALVKKELIPRASGKLGRLNQWQVWGWNTLWILVQMIESAQSLDPAVVAKHFRTMKTVQTIFGKGVIGGEKTFGINCVVGPPQAIYTAKGGQATFVKWVETSTP